jgi:pre-mRNA-splicing factor SYF1
MASSSGTLLSELSSLFPLTSPIPTLVSHPHLCPSSDLSIEHDLARNPTNLSRWFAYISSIKSAITAAENDARGSADDDTLALLGPKLATSAGRLGLQRLTDVYERALANFPTSFKLWKAYLDARSAYVLGRPAKAVKVSATKKKKDKGAGEGMYGFLKGNDEDLEDSERDVDVGPWEGALDGAAGLEEWRALAAAYERAIMWLPNVRPSASLSPFVALIACARTDAPTLALLLHPPPPPRMSARSRLHPCPTNV